MDKCHQFTDKQLNKLEKAIIKQYRESEKKAKLELSKIIEELNTIAVSDVKDRMRLLAKADKLRFAINNIAEQINNVNNVAVDLLNKALPNFYGENAIYTKYEIEKAIGGVIKDFSVNKDRIYQYMQENPNVFKNIAIDNLLDLEQIKRDTTRALYEGVIQGEGINKLYKRVNAVVGKNATTSLRIVRTEVGRIENLARVNTREEVSNMGFELEKRWIASIDSRTRHSHAMLQGVTIPLDEKFDNGLEYPCDPNGRTKEIVNCRCTTTTEFVGHDKTQAEIDMEEDIKKMSYEQYKKNYGGDFEWLL